MGRKFKRKFRAAVRIALPIVAGLAATAIAGPIAASASFGAIGKAATSAVVGGALQGAAAGVTGGDVGRAMIGGAAAGGVTSLVGSGIQAYQSGQIPGTSPALAAAQQGTPPPVGLAAPSTPQPSSGVQNILQSDPSTLTMPGQAPAAPQVPNYVQPSMVPAAPPPPPPTPIFDAGTRIRNIISGDPAGLAMPSQAPMMEPGTGPLARTTSVTGTSPQTLATQTPNFVQPEAVPSQPASTGATGLMSVSDVGVSTSPLDMMDRATAGPMIEPGTGPFPRNAAGEVIRPPVEAEPSFLQRVGSTAADMSKDIAKNLGSQYASELIVGMFSPRPGDPDPVPEFSMDYQNIYESMSPEEREMFDAARQEMEELAETNQELFQERLALSRAMLAEAGYFDPEYFGLMQQRATRTAMSQQERERQREEALRGGTPSDARARQAALDSALAGETAYLQGADFAQQQRLRTMQSGADMMPTSGPTTRLEYTKNVAGLMQPGYNRQRDQFLDELRRFELTQAQRQQQLDQQQSRSENIARTAGLIQPAVQAGFTSLFGGNS